MIIDGRQIAGEITAAVRADVTASGKQLVVRAVVVQPNAATESYLRVKSARAQEAGMQMEVVRLPADAQSEDVLAAIHACGVDGRLPDAVIVQLPLPESINSALVLDEIPLEKDADVLSSAAYERFTYDTDERASQEVPQELPILLPPVVAAIKEVLERAQVTVAGKRAVVIGSGRLVGQPAAVWLEREGADISILTVEDSEEDRRAQLAQADIIVSGAGSPHLIKPEHIKEGVVLIDAGTTELNGSLAGDADPECAQKASVFTPVPAGVGPISVACLFRNAASLALGRHLRKTEKSVD